MACINLWPRESIQLGQYYVKVITTQKKKKKTSADEHYCHARCQRINDHVEC